MSRATTVATRTDRHRLLDVGEELELVLDIFGREQLAGGEPADVLGAVDDLELAVRLDIAGVARLDEAVRGQRFGGLFGLAIIADEHARRFELNLAIPGDAQFDMRRRRADGVGADRAVGLRGHVKERLRLAVELLEVQSKRAIESEEVGADRFARGIGDADFREAEHVLERPVDQSSPSA